MEGCSSSVVTHSPSLNLSPSCLISRMRQLQGPGFQSLTMGAVVYITHFKNGFPLLAFICELWIWCASHIFPMHIKMHNHSSKACLTIFHPNPLRFHTQENNGADDLHEADNHVREGYTRRPAHSKLVQQALVEPLLQTGHCGKS